jgi:2-oxoglutarate dehydrogenase E1 component
MTDQSGNELFHNTSFLQGANADYVEQVYARYVANPGSVDESWRHFFAALGDDATAVKEEAAGAPWERADWPPQANGDWIAALDGQWPDAPAPKDIAKKIEAKAAEGGIGLNEAQVRKAVTDSIRAIMYIRSFRSRGHLGADLDPLGLIEKAQHPEFDPRFFGFAESDLDRPIFLDNVLGLETGTMREVETLLKRTYQGTFALQFMHLQDPEPKSWLQQRIEGYGKEIAFSKEGRRAILNKLVEAEGFEKFLHVKYTGTKRFGLDGGEAVVPALEQIIKRGGALGAKELVFGMPHRGRLSVLANVMMKPYRAIFNEFQGGSFVPESVEGSGDVKYHLGASADREFDGNNVHISLTANPSHLEAVNPVVLGKVRAKQVAGWLGPGIGDSGAAAWRRGVLGPGRGGGVLRAVGAEGAPDGRNDPCRGQQPDRLHDGAALQPLQPLPDRHLEDGRLPDLPCERRRPRSGGACGQGGDRVPPEVQARRGDRRLLLSPVRAQ